MRNAYKIATKNLTVKSKMSTHHLLTYLLTYSLTHSLQGVEFI